MYEALKRLKFWNVQVFTVATGADLSDRTGRVLATVMGLKHETDLEEIRDRTRRGMAGQITRGYSAGGAPYGYKSIPEYDPMRKDEYGRPVIVGVHKAIDEEEAKVVRRIFEEYAAGSSPKTIVHRLNAERVPPPRPKQGRQAQGWTWTTVRGILRNRLYLGEVYWNRSGKQRDPENPKRRVTRRRPRSEWLRGPDQPELRVIHPELWEQVETRRKEATSQNKGRHGGPRPQYLFSGLLRCGVCGSHYIIKDRRGYACSFYLNRGPHVCPNKCTVKREILERVLLAEIQNEILSPQAVAYLTAQVNKVLERERSRVTPARRALEEDLHKVEQEIENIKQAVRLGKATVTLLEMLEEAERKATGLQAELSSPRKDQASVHAIPRLVEQFVRDLRATLGRDVHRARALLSRLLGVVVLRPEKDGLMYEMRGNVGALLGEQAVSAATGAGRGI